VAGAFVYKACHVGTPAHYTRETVIFHMWLLKLADAILVRERIL
jgi:hypothetical protein